MQEQSTFLVSDYFRQARALIFDYVLTQPDMMKRLQLPDFLDNILGKPDVNNQFFVPLEVAKKYEFCSQILVLSWISYKSLCMVFSKPSQRNSLDRKCSVQSSLVRIWAPSFTIGYDFFKDFGSLKWKTFASGELDFFPLTKRHNQLFVALSCQSILDINDVGMYEILSATPLKMLIIDKGK
jgi:hypothetical protein